jgi:hypothetical protein
MLYIIVGSYYDPTVMSIITASSFQTGCDETFTVMCCIVAVGVLIRRLKLHISFQLLQKKVRVDVYIIRSYCIKMGQVSYG